MLSTFDLSNCDKEPIHIPGKIQPHGFLLSVEVSGFIITHVSNNIKKFINASAEQLLTKPLFEFEKILQPADKHGNDLSIAEKLYSFTKAEITNPTTIVTGGTYYNLVVTKNTNYFLLEFEPAAEENKDIDLQRALGKAVSNLLTGSGIADLMHRAAAHIRSLINYNRVMIYKFSSDHHGEVVAEAKSDHTSSFLGLHFPSSDIPEQARELYKKQHTRIITDVDADSAGIVTYEAAPLDLSCSELRAVSPVHIQYLKNMKVKASFSISLMNRGELWGLMACHNETPKFIDYSTREAARLIGKILSYSLEFREQEEESNRSKIFYDVQEKIFKVLRSAKNIGAALVEEKDNIKEVISCGGAAILFDNKVHFSGITPGENAVVEIGEWLKNSVDEGIFCSNVFYKKFKAAKAFTDSGSGILVATLSKASGDYIIWFRPELLQTVRWAGNPEKPVATEDGTTILSPRKSFETWIENVSGSCTPWTKTELSFANKLREEVSFAINRKAAETKLLHEKLKYAYDELDTFSYSISHDLKNPLAVIKSYSEILQYNAKLDEKSKDLIKKISASANKMNRLINDVLKYSRIGSGELKFTTVDMEILLHDAEVEILTSLKPENLQLDIQNTPAVYGEITMISQVFNNLVSNAVKYSSKSNPSVVIINGEDNGKEVIYTVSDNGLGIDEAHHKKIFELFTRLPQVKHYEGAGIGLAIVKRMIEKHNGRIWLQSKPGEGTVFFIALPKSTDSEH